MAAIPFWGLGIIAALLLIIFTYSDGGKDCFKRNDNKFAGIALAIPGFAIAALKFKPDSFVSETEYPLYGTMSNFMFGVIGTIFLFSLIKWSAAFFNDKKADKKKWIDFFKLKPHDLLWVVVPFALGFLDSFVVQAQISLDIYWKNFMPTMEPMATEIPILAWIFRSEIVSAMLYLIIGTILFMLLCNNEKINKFVAIGVIAICLLGVLRFYLGYLTGAIGFSNNIVNTIGINGLSISAVLLSMPLGISIKSLQKAD